MPYIYRHILHLGEVPATPVKKFSPSLYSFPPHSSPNNGTNQVYKNGRLIPQPVLKKDEQGPGSVSDRFYRLNGRQNVFVLISVAAFVFPFFKTGNQIFFFGKIHFIVV